MNIVSVVQIAMPCAKKAPMIPNDEIREEAFIKLLMKWSEEQVPARSTILFTLFNALSVTMIEFMEHKVSPEALANHQNKAA